MYNTLLRADDPAIVVEVLNGYRRSAKVPANVGDFTVPLGVPEVIREGGDVTVVTYGACCAIVLEAAELLAAAGIEAEVIDVQTLLPFDRGGMIGESLKQDPPPAGRRRGRARRRFGLHAAAGARRARVGGTSSTRRRAR